MMLTINYQRLRYLVATVLLLLSTVILTGCVDLEAIATTPDGHILLLKEIEREDASDEQNLYVCRDLKGKIPQLSCDSNLKF
jgi:hypothetical protein